MTDREMAALLASRGVRPTQQRIAVFHYLHTHRNHPSADTIFQALSLDFPVFSRTTIYNSLNTLVEAGLVRPINISADEQRFDACTEDHGHFLCSECHQIFDFTMDSAVVASLCPAGFTCTHSNVYVDGICSSCGSSAS